MAGAFLLVVAPSSAAQPTCRGVPATIVGTPGDDVLVGSAANDVIYAGAGADHVRGGGGADYICGGPGDDRLFGEAGVDYLLGEADDDLLDGGKDLDTADFSTAPGAVTADLGAGKATGDGVDKLSRIEGILGSRHDDDLFGTPAADNLNGLAGADLVMGLDGDDSLSGGGGDDTLRGGGGSDLVTGNAGTDVCVDAETRDGCERGGGTLRLDQSSDFDYVDPALSFFSHSWQLHNTTCMRLVGYPDEPAPEGSTLVPEAAGSLPTISANGRKYTFRIRHGIRFSPPSNEVVTAQTFKFTFERDLAPIMQSPSFGFVDDIVGADKYHAGQASEISGIVANGMKLTITLKAARGDFLARLAVPFFCAVPTDAPISPEGALLPSAGPYHLVEWNEHQSALAVRNPNYRGRRASNFDRIVWTSGITPANQVLRVEAGQTDLASSVPAAERRRLHETYGPGSPAEAAGRQSYFVEPLPVLWYIVLNTDRPTFEDETLRRAVAYALNRVTMTSIHGYDGGAPTDQILPPTIAGYVNHDLFPLTGNLATAQALAAEAGVTPENPITVQMYSFNVTTGPPIALYVKDALAPLGIDVNIQLFDRLTQHQKMRTPGEPFDIGLEGWGADYNDPYNFLDKLLHGANLPPPGVNVSYFDDPLFNAWLDAASAATGPARYSMYADLDRELSAAAPIVPYINTNRILFFSERIGCHAFNPLFSTALNALCLR